MYMGASQEPEDPKKCPEWAPYILLDKETVTF